MGFFTKLLILILIVFIVLLFIPTGVFGEATFDVTVSVRVNQQKLIGVVPGVDEWNLDQVTYTVEESNVIELGQTFGTFLEPTRVVFCIDSNCQANSEIFFITGFFGEQRSTSETLHYVEKGTHSLNIKLFVEDDLKDTITETITI